MKVVIIRIPTSDTRENHWSHLANQIRSGPIRTRPVFSGPIQLIVA